MIGQKITVISDMDDVLAQWCTGFASEFERDYPERTILPMPLRDTFNMFRDEDAEHHAQILELMNKPGFYAQLKPIPGAVEALNDMRDRGIDVIIATSPWLTNRTCMVDKMDWLDEHMGPGWSDRAIITKDKTRVRGTFLFDDKPDVLGGAVPEWEHIYYTQPHNAARTDHRRINHWSEALDVVLGASSRLVGSL